MNTRKLGNVTLTYDEDTKKISENGKLSTKYKAVYLRGESEPEFFGFLDTSKGIVYDVYGGNSPITKEDSIDI